MSNTSLNKSWFNRYFYSLIFSLGFLIFGLIRTQEVVNHTAVYQKKMEAHVQLLNFKDRLFNAKEWSLLFINKAFDFVEDSEWTSKEQIAVNLLLEAEDEYKLAQNKSIEIGVTGIALLLLVFLLNSKNNYKQQLVIPFFSVCFLFLTLGILSPMLEISASNTNLEIPIAIDLSSISSPIEKGLKIFDDLTGLDTAKKTLTKELSTTIKFDGKIYFYYQSKSIWQLISLLFKDKNMIVGIAILLFSILLPLLKLTLTLLLALANKPFKIVSKIISSLGKWSMADVFVASCFLAFLSFSNLNVGIDTESNILFGLYFFLSYVLLSIIMSSLVKND